MRRRLTATLSAAAALFAGAAAASRGPPWLAPDVPALPPGAQSARVLLADQPLFTAPWGTAPRRGTVARDVHLPIFAAKRGAGCTSAWLQVGPSAWVCDQAVEIGPRVPIDPRRHTFPETSDGLPFRYFFVGPEGSLAYKRAEAVDIGEPDMELEPGFAVAIVAERAFDGARYGRTGHDLWVPMRDLGPIRSFAFQGEAIPRVSDGGAPVSNQAGSQASAGVSSSPTPPDVTSIPFAWVASDRAKVFSRPSAGALTSTSRSRFEVVSVFEEAQTFAGKFTRVGDDAWIASKDLRRPILAEPPNEVDVAAGERWIDVELASQTLVAYEGKRPVFATIVSTGKGRQGTALATPMGTYRIWIKLLAADMDNLEDENAARYYRMEDVPYVQYFSKGVGLHGAFWHRSFGRVRSHGCVNLAPLDAQRLFWWTGPHLPAGWTAVFPTKSEPGTIVRVR
jgi:lipoprotein-anchoring transpeptidase ErfK/SrfK